MPHRVYLLHISRKLVDLCLVKLAPEPALEIIQLEHGELLVPIEVYLVYLTTPGHRSAHHWLAEHARCDTLLANRCVLQHVVHDMLA